MATTYTTTNGEFLLSAHNQSVQQTNPASVAPTRHWATITVEANGTTTVSASPLFIERLPCWFPAALRDEASRLVLDLRTESTVSPTETTYDTAESPSDTLSEDALSSGELPADAAEYWSNKEGISDQYYEAMLRSIGQKACKSIAKSWIKFLEPKKQSRHPYRGGDRTRPVWWPLDIIHREPDHLTLTPRVKLMIAILRCGYKPIDDLEREMFLDIGNELDGLGCYQAMKEVFAVAKYHEALMQRRGITPKYLDQSPASPVRRDQHRRRNRTSSTPHRPLSLSVSSLSLSSQSSGAPDQNSQDTRMDEDPATEPLSGSDGGAAQFITPYHRSVDLSSSPVRNSSFSPNTAGEDLARSRSMQEASSALHGLAHTPQPFSYPTPQSISSSAAYGGNAMFSSPQPSPVTTAFFGSPERAAPTPVTSASPLGRVARPTFARQNSSGGLLRRNRPTHLQLPDRPDIRSIQNNSGMKTTPATGSLQNMIATPPPLLSVPEQTELSGYFEMNPVQASPAAQAWMAAAPGMVQPIQLQQHQQHQQNLRVVQLQQNFRNMLAAMNAPSMHPAAFGAMPITSTGVDNVATQYTAQSMEIPPPPHHPATSSHHRDLASLAPSTSSTSQYTAQVAEGDHGRSFLSSPENFVLQSAAEITGDGYTQPLNSSLVTNQGSMEWVLVPQQTFPDGSQ